MSRFVVLCVLLFGGFSFSGVAFAVNEPHPYYGHAFYDSLAQGAHDEDLKNTIVTILRSSHMLREGEFDEVVPSCSGQGKCYQHTPVGYYRARLFVLGDFYLVKTGNSYAVRDVYCEKLYTEGVGPGKIPDNSMINVEHTWPQSRFNGQFDKETQKSDLHHLYPTDSKMNGVRGNFPFGEVVQEEQHLKCDTVHIGHTKENHGMAFEPPTAHKGNVARSLFYFALKYGMQISQDEEKYLRQWHKEDPVSDEEFDRNDQIYRLQGSRNPFIDHPEIVDSISNF